MTPSPFLFVIPNLIGNPGIRVFRLDTGIREHDGRRKAKRTRGLNLADLEAAVVGVFTTAEETIKNPDDLVIRSLGHLPQQIAPLKKFLEPERP